ncbi:MAG: Clp protease N-terminal domain-containing protein [Actinomycetota bacterium]
MDLGDNGIGTEHLLLGLLAEGKDDAARMVWIVKAMNGS